MSAKTDSHQKPLALKVCPENIPGRLQEGRCFVVWRWEWKVDRWDKPPRQPNGSLAKVDDPETWVTFAAAMEAYATGKFDGIGRVMVKADGLVGIDHDSCVDFEARTINPQARGMVDLINSYTELSPSGTGVRQFTFGELPAGGRKKGDVELYDSDRYLTLTGHRVDGQWRSEPLPSAVMERGAEILELHRRVFGANSNGEAKHEPRALGGSNLTAYEIVKLAEQHKSADKWARLMRGDLSDYSGDDSRADSALCFLAAFYTDDPGVIDQIVRMSGLCRDKWTERPDYRDRTISGALQLVTERYSAPSGEPAKPAKAAERSGLGAMAAPSIRPPELASEAYYGLAGRIVQLVESYVESDRASILIQFLTAFGVAAGIRPHFMVGATRHAPTLFSGLIGRTSRARKGTGWDPIEYLFKASDPDFGERIMSGIGSGERLVWLVRDQTEDEPGAKDRRLLIREPELARLLVVVNREGSTMSAYLREAFDGKPMRNEVKTHGSTSSFHHVGMIGHCTAEEVRARLTDQQIRNGLANRILWTLARRETRLSKPPIFEGKAVDHAIEELRERLGAAATIGRLERSDAADNAWDEWYQCLSDEGAGLVAAITDRAEAHVARLAMIYALMDGSPIIGVEHLAAAFAFWDYSAACVGFIWGQTTGDPMADRILEELVYGPIDQSEIHREVFYGRASGTTVEAVGRLLERQGRIVRERIKAGDKGGRPSVRWRLK